MKNHKKGSIHQNFLKKISGGFTLIELLIVVAIIAILTVIVLAFIGSSTTRSKSAAFKSEINSLQKAFAVACSTNNISSADIQQAKTFKKDDIIFEGTPNPPETLVTQSCGLAGGTFSVDIPSTNGAGCVSAYVTEDGATFSPAGC